MTLCSWVDVNVLRKLTFGVCSAPPPSSISTISISVAKWISIDLTRRPALFCPPWFDRSATNAHAAVSTLSHTSCRRHRDPTLASPLDLSAIVSIHFELSDCLHPDFLSESSDPKTL